MRVYNVAGYHNSDRVQIFDDFEEFMDRFRQYSTTPVRSHTMTRNKTDAFIAFDSSPKEKTVLLGYEPNDDRGFNEYRMTYSVIVT